MPDWSYHPLIKPLVFRLAPQTGRALLLGALGTLGRVPGGLALVELLGHMDPPPALQTRVDGLSLVSPLALGCEIDPEGRAAAALSRFGFGLLEVGPVTLSPVPGSIGRDLATSELLLPELPANGGLARFLTRLGGTKPSLPRAIRLAVQPDASPSAAMRELETLLGALAPSAALFTLDWPLAALAGRWSSQAWTGYIAGLCDLLRALPEPRPLWLCLPANLRRDELETLSAAAVGAGVQGIVVGGLYAPGSPRRLGPAERDLCAASVSLLRERYGRSVTLVGAGGVLEPADGLLLRDVGADLVLLQSGMVFSGPGLAKRLNEALHIRLQSEPAEARGRRTSSAIADTPTTAARTPRATSVAAFWRSAASGLIATGQPLRWSAVLSSLPAWLWLALLGLGMVVSGLVAAVVAATLVVLPYDEAFVGLSRAEIGRLNPRLLAFMTHDRIALAGTMISIGLLYLTLALHGVRYGWRWAWHAIMASAGLGFASFFLFLGFGYFDPLHAVLSLVLLVCFVGGLRGLDGASPAAPRPDLRNDRAWHAGLWGQLLFVGLGAGLLTSGLAITLVGVTSVFVPEDLAFLRTTAEQLGSANQRLVPLIAHDRAGFGGALVSCGLCVLLVSLWGFRRGARWVWWTLLVAGAPGFAGALGIHLLVGYLDLWHLAPALLASGVYLLGLLLAYPFLCRQGPML